MSLKTIEHERASALSCSPLEVCDLIAVTTELKETTKKALNVIESSRYMKHHDVLVGVPQENSSRKGGEITNAELLFIHSNGSPLNGIPARKVIEPAVEQPEVLESIANELRTAILASLDGRLSGAESGLEKAGTRGENAAKEYFNGANNWPPNSPVTIARKGSSQPLIDTGAMRQAITHVVREK